MLIWACVGDVDMGLCGRCWYGLVWAMLYDRLDQTLSVTLVLLTLNLSTHSQNSVESCSFHLHTEAISYVESNHLSLPYWGNILRWNSSAFTDSAQINRTTHQPLRACQNLLLRNCQVAWTLFVILPGIISWRIFFFLIQTCKKNYVTDTSSAIAEFII